MAFVELNGISKSYGGVHALRPLDLEIHVGEVLAVCGENGAGKSTLNKILSGSVSPDSGTVRMDGRELVLGSVAEAERAGIAIVHQESAAFLHLSATENHQIMREPVGAGGLWLDRGEMRRRAIASLAGLGESFNPDTPLQARSLAQRQMVAIARAVDHQCRLLILDEPTASLSARETDALFAAIRDLRERGVAIIYVSHRLDEVFELADRVAVLCDGQLVAVKAVSETSQPELIQLMVGRAVEFEKRESQAPGELLLEVENLTSGPFRDVSFSVRAGEVVAVAGLVGAGRSEVARAIFGLDRYQGGTVKVGGKPLPRGVESAIRCGLALVPEDRQHQGLHLPLSVRDNLMMASRPGQKVLIDRKVEADGAKGLVESLSIKTASDLAAVASLSGGNQQKVLLGKWLATQPKVLILDEPTRGVDVGAKDQIHRLISALAKEGVAIVVISSEMNEVLALGDRVLVMRQGSIASELSRAEATQARVLELALPQDVPPPPGPLPMWTRGGGGSSRTLGVGLLLFATVILAAIVNPAFLSADNLRDMLVRVSPAIIVGTMMTLVILAREIDISVGSLMGLCAATLGIAASTDRMGLPPAVAVLLCLGVGVLGGLVNGVLVAHARIPSIIVTLGTLTLFKGVTELAMGGKWIEKMPLGLRALGTQGVLGIPYVVIVAVLTVLLGVWITRRSRLGLQVFALGSNPHAAELHGVRVRRVKLAVFALTGLGAAIAALFSATQLQVIESGFGGGFELVAIASVIVGGTSIRGGQGSVIGTVLGASLLGIVSTVLIFLKLGESSTYWERAIQGGFILLAVLGDHLGRRNRRQA